jgi:hypothetical protein
VGKTSFTNNVLTSSDADWYVDIFLHYRNSNNMIMAIGSDYTYSKYYLIPNRDSWKISSNFFVGWSYWMDLAMAIKDNNVNNPVYLHLNNMACLALAATGRIKSVHVLNEFSIPTVGIYFGSRYSSPLPHSILEDDANVFEDFSILFVHQNLHLQNKLSADFKLNLKRRSGTMRLQYVLGMRRLYLNNNEVNNIYHQLRIGYLFNETPYVHK